MEYKVKIFFQTDTSGWRIVFLSAAGVALFCNTAFLVFGTAKCQEWDDPDYLNKRKADPGSTKYSIIKDKKNLLIRQSKTS